jgi:hypothetical protein
MEPSRYLTSGQLIDSAAPTVIEFARDVAAGGRDDRERVLLLYPKIRDGIVYDPYLDFFDASVYRASSVLAAGRSFCVGKAALLSACARAIGVPARVGYADVRNHLTSPRLQAMFQTDLFVWHSYSELYLDGRWVKATPAFNRALCDRIGIHPLEFDGLHDSLFHPFDRAGRQHMEYVLDRGSFDDVPFARIVADFRAYYPALNERLKVDGDFQQEVVAGADERI